MTYVVCFAILLVYRKRTQGDWELLGESREGTYLEVEIEKQNNRSGEKRLE